MELKKHSIAISGQPRTGDPKKGVKKEISDTQRYKTLGNAVTTKVVELIIKKIYNNN